LTVAVVFHRLAAKEARTARKWYEQRSPEAAERFHAAVVHATGKIREDVGTHPVGKSQFRYVRVGRFPYCLIYCLESPSTAKVVAVMHFRRRPGYWRHRAR
jgi:hypothetical protein